jgi:hypothetical protein
MRIFVWTMTVLTALPAFARPTFNCEGNYSTNEHISYSAALINTKTLAAVTYSFSSSDGSNVSVKLPAMSGVSDASAKSPLAGLRFYFKEGNTSDFLLFADGLTATLLTAKKGYVFNTEEVFEQYENGGSREVAELKCEITGVD